MGRIELYHGSRNVVEKPVFDFGNHRNDYGEGFYCTENRESAGEWACSDGNDGIINSYTLDTSDLDVLHLNSDERSSLLWLRILIENRCIRPNTPIMEAGMRWLKNDPDLDVPECDVITGCAADDSRFSFVQAFLSNGISLEQLSYAMALGNLGEQVVLKSKKAFDSISFNGFEEVDAGTYHVLFENRDKKARMDFSMIRTEHALDGLFIRDLIREEVRSDDPRLQRTVS